MRGIYIVLTSCLLIIGFQGLAQDTEPEFKPKKGLRKANSLFRAERYDEALDIYLNHINDFPEELIRKDFLNYRIAFCFYNQPNKKIKAIPFFEQYLSISDSIFEAHFFLGKLYHFFHDFDKAIEHYEHFKRIVKADTITEQIVIDDVVASTDREIKQCNNGKSLVKNPVEVVIENLGKKINTEYKEYGPVISSDETHLVFTTRGPVSPNAKLSPDGDYYEDIMISNLREGSNYKRPEFDAMRGSGYYSAITKFKFSKPKPISDKINSKTHDGAIQFSADNSSLYFYRNYRVWRSEKKTFGWTEPHQIKSMSNAFDEKAFEPSVSFSGGEDTMYFSSDRDGGYGGLDLYRSVKLGDGTWSEGVNLGDLINTETDEDAPYIDPNGHILYFSSKGHSSMGEYDVFRASWDGQDWHSPKNLGYPINSAGNDVFFMMTPMFNRAYYSSDKVGGYGQMDLYRITFAEERARLAEIMGKVLKGANMNPAKAKLTIYDGKFRSELYSETSDSLTGAYMLRMSHGKEYAVKIEAYGYAPYIKVFDIPKQAHEYQFYQEIHHIHLKDKGGNIIGQKVNVRNAFFNKDSLKRETVASMNMKNPKVFELLKKEEANSNNMQVREYTDVKFYMTEKSVDEMAKKQPDLNLNLPAEANVTFMEDEKQEKTVIENYIHPRKELAKNIQEPIKEVKQAVIKMSTIIEETEMALQAAKKNLESTSNMTPETYKKIAETTKKLEATKKAIAKTQTTMALTNDESDESITALEEVKVMMDIAKASLTETNQLIKTQAKADKTSAHSYIQTLQSTMKEIEKTDDMLSRIHKVAKAAKYSSFLSKNEIRKLAANVQLLRANMNRVKASGSAKAQVAETKKILDETEASLKRTDSLMYGGMGNKEEVAAELAKNKELLVKTQQSLLKTQVKLNQAPGNNDELNKTIFAMQSSIAETETNIRETQNKIEAEDKAAIISETKEEIRKVYEEFTILQDLSPEAHASMTQTRNILISTQKELGVIEDLFEDYEGLSFNLQKSVLKTKELVVASQASLAKAKNILRQTNEYTPEIDSLILDAKKMLAKTQVELSKTHEKIVVANQAKEIAKQRHELIKLNEQLLSSEVATSAEKETVKKAQEKIISSVENLAKTEELFEDFDGTNTEIIESIKEDKKLIEETKKALLEVKTEMVKDTTKTEVAEALVTSIEETQESMAEAEVQVTIISETELRNEQDSETAKEDVAETITTIIEVHQEMEMLEEAHPESAEDIKELQTVMQDAQESLINTESLLYDYYGPTENVKESLKKSQDYLQKMRESLDKLKTIKSISADNSDLIIKFDNVIKDTEISLQDMDIKLGDISTGDEAIAEMIVVNEAEDIKEEELAAQVAANEKLAETSDNVEENMEEIVVDTNTVNKGEKKKEEVVVEANTDNNAKQKNEETVVETITNVDEKKEETTTTAVTTEKKARKVRGAETKGLTTTVFFGKESYDLNAEAHGLLKEVVDYLKKNPDSKCKIIGHTDSRGDRDYNRHLSLGRAINTLKFIMEADIRRKRFKLIAKGEEELARTENSEDDRSYNRRAEIILYNP